MIILIKQWAQLYWLSRQVGKAIAANLGRIENRVLHLALSIIVYYNNRNGETGLDQNSGQGSRWDAWDNRGPSRGEGFSFSAKLRPATRHAYALF